MYNFKHPTPNGSTKRTDHDKEQTPNPDLNPSPSPTSTTSTSSHPLKQRTNLAQHSQTTPVQLLPPRPSFGFGTVDLLHRFPLQDPPRSPVSFADAWSKWATSVSPSNQQVAARVVEGAIPAFLEGEWYRNGPGKFEVGGMKVKALDGDGLVYRVVFTKGKQAWVESKFVQTQGFINDTLLQKRSSRGAFGTQCTTGFFANYLPLFKNPANTNIAFWGGKLFALWEGGPPHILDHASLDTLGKGARFLRAGEAFGAHPKVDCNRQRFVNIGTNVIANCLSPWQKDRLLVWEIDQDCVLTRKQSVPLRHRFALLHDFCITQHFTIVPQSPIGLNTFNLAVGGNLGTALHPTDNKLLFYVIPRHQSNPTIKVFEAERWFVLHCINAYETAHHEVVIDVVAYSVMPRFAELMDSVYLEHLDSQSSGKLTTVLRYTLCLDCDEEQVKCTPLVQTSQLGTSVEFPCINSIYQGSPYNYAYFVDITPEIEGTHRYPFSAVVKLDLKARSLRKWVPEQRGNERVFLGDPVFVPRPTSTLHTPNTEDDGLLIVSCFHVDSTSTKLCLVDAKTLTTVTRLDLGMKIPVGLHTAWVDSTEVAATRASDRRASESSECS